MLLAEWNSSSRGGNSGCANACTGDQGLGDAEQMASLAARKLGLGEVLVASSGVIGTRLPMNRIRSGIERIELSPDGDHDLARAIMTTDTTPKEIAVITEINGKEVIIRGVAKGAGMIHPDMATMLWSLTLRLISCRLRSKGRLRFPSI